MRRSTTLVAATLIGGALLAACSSGSTISTAATSSPVRSGSGPATTTPTEAPVSSEPPVPVESNPPGDIPDNTVFVPYHWPGKKSANLLTNRALDPISKIPEYKVCACRVEKA